MEEDEESNNNDNQSHFQFLRFSLANQNVLPAKTHGDVSMKQLKGKLHNLNLCEVILLDNQSTMSLFCNKRFVTNVCNSKEPLTLHSNRGSMEMNKLATIGEGKPNVWFSSRVITNILSLKDIVSCYCKTYNSYNKAFIVWREQLGLNNMILKMHSSGLHFYDPKHDKFSFVVTVADNMKLFSHQLVGAEKVRSLHTGLAFPSESDYKRILKSNQVQECPVTLDDEKIMTKIWGESVASLKGKTTRKAPSAILTDIIEVPAEIQELHQIVTISIDIVFVNKMPFFLTLSRKICFSTVTHLANCKIGTIFAAFKSIFIYYLQKGFQIMTVTANNKFAPLAELLYDLPGAPTLNLTSANKHKPFIEQRICMVKE